jgi:hypothetical protein
LETDDEVRARIRARGWSYWQPAPDVRSIRGKALDDVLAQHGLAERKLIEDES